MNYSHHLDSVGQSNGVAMSRADYSAIEHACDHTARALSAAQSAEPFDSIATVILNRVRGQLVESLRELRAIKANARVTL